jgi:hypothetical protein
VVFCELVTRIQYIKLRSVQTTVWLRSVTNILHFQSLFTPDYLGSRKISGTKIREHRNNGVRHNMLRRSMATLKCYACRPCFLPCASPVTLHSVHTKLGSADKDKKCATDKRFGLLALVQTVGPLTVPFRPFCFQIYFDARCVTS